MFKLYPCVKEEAGQFSASTHEVIEEIPLMVMVNGRHALTVMSSPTLIRELVTGLLFTERIIQGPEEIDSIQVEPDKVSVLTKNPFKILVSKKTVLSGCGGTASFLDVARTISITSDFCIDVSAIETAVKMTLTSDLHIKTGGIHLIGLFNAGGAICISEDIGRHNALDRVIGYGLISKTDFSRCFVISSGRISSDMVRKCLVAGIPIIISRGATTSLALDLAEKSGLTVIGFVRGKKMIIYTHTRRIKGAIPLGKGSP